jgi:hypothetical protein
MSKTVRNETRYMEKLTALIDYLKDKNSPMREAVLRKIREGGLENVSEMLLNFGREDTPWREVPLERWKKKEIKAIQRDWQMIFDAKNVGLFWTWDVVHPPEIPEHPLP